jgi:hypothetical protein
MSKKKSGAAFALSLALGLIFVLLGIFLGKDIVTLVLLGAPAVICLIIAAWQSPWVSKTRRDKTTWLRRGIALSILAIVLSIGAGWALWRYASDLPWRSHGPLSISPGVAFTSVWSSTSLNTGYFWILHDYPRNIAPVNIVAFYTLTNLKSTPLMISNLYLEVEGVGGGWYELTRINPHAGRFVDGTLDKPTDVTEIEFPAGFLLDKLENRPLNPGEPVQGWMLFQYPPSYIAPANNDLRMRMVVVDTAHDEVVVPLLWPRTQGEVLYSEMRGQKVNINLKDYDVFQYPTPR